MGPNEIMERLSVFGHDQPLPREALAEAVRQREAVTPLLLDRLDWLLENIQELGEDIYDEVKYNQCWYAFFLLAQFREKRAYPKFISILRLDSELLDIAIGEEVTDADDLLYSTYDGDLAAAQAVASDSSLDPFAREAAIKLMSGLFRDGRLSREDLIGFIRERLSSIGDGEDEETFAAMLALVTASAGLYELREDVRQVYRRDRVDFTLMGDFSSFLDTLFDEDKHERRTALIEDAAEELSTWACFKRDTPSQPSIAEIMSWNAGRNDPCPCGSGKKFKKCCLKRLEEWESRTSRYSSTERDTYPPVAGRGGQPGLGNFYSKDAIAVDMPAYRALKLLSGPPFRQRTEENRARRQARDLLWEAFQETKRICAQRGMTTPGEFDREYSVHYDCTQWLEQLVDLLDREDPRRREAEQFLHSQPER